MASYPPENNHILPENSRRSQHSRPVSTIEEKESKINSMFSAISDKSKIDVEIKISMAEIGEMSGDRDEPEINRLLSLIISTFYSNKEFFVYEIIKNSSELLRFESLIDKIKPELFIRIVPVHFNTALSVIDPKVGADVSVIGKFRVGLYSAYLVAERVVVTTKHNDDVQYIWVSQAGGSFTVTRNINGQPLGRGTKITLFIKDDLAIRKFADVNLLPDPPIFERGGDEEESDSSEIFRERIPPDVAEGPGGVEVDEEVESQIQKFLEEKEIIIYEEQDGGELEQLAEFTLFGVKGYYTFAKKVRSCYPNRVEGSIAHVLWPWWPEYQDVSYRGGAGRLDPLRLWWDEFAERLDHVIVHKRQENIPVVFLRKCGNQPVLLDIPKSSITSKKRLDQIIHFYSASYGRKEPYDGGESPLDPWFGYIISYKNLNFQTLDWEEEFFEPWELQTQGEQFGEEDRGGEVEDGGVVEEHVIEEEIHEEDRVEWNEFLVSLKYINVMPLDNPEQDQAFKSSIKRRRI